MQSIHCATEVWELKLNLFWWENVTYPLNSMNTTWLLMSRAYLMSVAAFSFALPHLHRFVRDTNGSCSFIYICISYSTIIWCLHRQWLLTLNETTTRIREGLRVQTPVCCSKSETIIKEFFSGTCCKLIQGLIPVWCNFGRDGFLLAFVLTGGPQGQFCWICSR